MKTTVRELTFIFRVREPKDIPLGQTIVNASQALAVALESEGLVVERTDVRGVEVDV